MLMYAHRLHNFADRDHTVHGSGALGATGISTNPLMWSKFLRSDRMVGFMGSKINLPSQFMPGVSFVPAETAILGVVDKSKHGSIYHRCTPSTDLRQSSLGSKHANLCPGWTFPILAPPLRLTPWVHITGAIGIHDRPQPDFACSTQLDLSVSHSSGRIWKRDSPSRLVLPLSSSQYTLLTTLDCLGLWCSVLFS